MKDSLCLSSWKRNDCGSEMTTELNPKNALFVEHYLQCWNATEAAKRAGYSEKTAYSQGSRLLKNAEIKGVIQTRISEVAMGADEVLVRLAAHGRGSMEQFLTIERVKYPTRVLAPDPDSEKPNAVKLVDGEEERVITVLDFEKAKAGYALHLVKSFKDSPKDGLEIELYDAQAALVHLGRHHALFTDKIAQTGEGLDLLRQFLSDGGEEVTSGE